MKKIMWIVAVLPVVVASMMLQVIPDMIPHKIGIFIFPIVILCVTFFWHLPEQKKWLGEAVERPDLPTVS